MKTYVGLRTKNENKVIVNSQVLNKRLDLLNRVAGNTVGYRQKEWIDNFFANLPEIRGGYGVLSLDATLPGIPALLVGSGPTLNYNIDQIPALQDLQSVLADNRSFPRHRKCLKLSHDYPNL